MSIMRHLIKDNTILAVMSATKHNGITHPSNEGGHDDDDGDDNHDDEGDGHDHDDDHGDDDASGGAHHQIFPLGFR